ncbi:MAG TPA: DUF2752 domain-containing protein [Acidimicrobiia bacterium]
MHASPTRLHEREVRVAAGGMVAVAAVWPVLPVHPPFACPLRSLTGIPCPLCGMTRAVVAAAHGHLSASLAFNPGGILVLALAVIAILRPAWPARLQVPTWSLFSILGVLWVWNIGFNPTFHQLLLR